MNTYNVFIFALVATVLLVGCAPTQTPSSDGQQPVQSQQPAAQTPETSQLPTPEPAPEVVVPVETRGITAAELAQHDARSDCWVGYEGTVYDITAFIDKHPGGAGALIPLCGTSSEFEEAFTGQHGTSKVSVLQREATDKGPLI